MLDLLLPPRPPVPRRAPEGARAIDLAGETMGTGWSMQALVPQELADGLVEVVLERSFAAVIAQMSQWHEKSQISLFNQGAPGSWHAIGAQFSQVLTCALMIDKASGGAFNPLIGGASAAWGFGANAASNTPEPDYVSSSAGLSAILTDDPQTLFQPGGAMLDLSGIAKGYAVDLGLVALNRLGIDHALLDIGGELKAIGLRADGLPWWVDLAIPPGSAAGPTRLGLTDWGLATSGHWERRRSDGANSWSHTLGPLDGRPINDELTASVLHPGCMQADALATALIVLGMDEGIAFADRHRLPARIVGPQRVVESAAWRAWKQ